VSWCIDILEAIVYLHTLPSPIIHRDLKLENILLTMDGGTKRAVIVDFGLVAVRPR
jgi:eukaryotic-like serine/threonine-protein kinase